MTTAARPTWTPARGGYTLRDTGKAPVHVTAVRDLASHTTLKLRSDTTKQDKYELKRQLLQKEREHFEKARKKRITDVDVGQVVHDREEKRRRLLQLAGEDVDDRDDGEGVDSSDSSSSDGEGESGGAEKKLKRKRRGRSSSNDERESESESSSSDSDSDDSDDDDDEDEEAALLRELEKIKRERAEERERQEQARQAEAEAAMEAQALTSNPLLATTFSGSSTQNFAVKRRWDDDVVFKNQAKGVSERPQKRFINDMLRSDFHKKFMNKYVR